MDHAELEEELERHGRELLRQLMQDHLDLRALREEESVRRSGAPLVCGADGRVRPHLESGHLRLLACLFGIVRVRRLAHRQKGLVNVYPADVELSLPAARHSMDCAVWRSKKPSAAPTTKPRPPSGGAAEKRSASGSSNSS